MATTGSAPRYRQVWQALRQAQQAQWPGGQPPAALQKTPKGPEDQA